MWEVEEEGYVVGLLAGEEGGESRCAEWIAIAVVGKVWLAFGYIPGRWPAGSSER